MSDSRPVGVAVVGAGTHGAKHARWYAKMPDAKLVTIIDADPDRARALAEELGCSWGADLDALPEAVEAASVAVPTPLHAKVSLELLGRGVHLLVEKPITSTLEEAEALLSEAEARDLVLQVGHIERFGSAQEEVEGILTRPLFIEAHRLGPPPGRELGVGVVLDLMIHDIDLALHLVGEQPDAVDAVGVAVLSPQEDIANARLSFPSGAVANLTASRVSPEPMRKLRVFQSDAYISIDYLAERFEVHRLVGGRIERSLIAPDRRDKMQRQLEHFLDCVRGSGRPRVTGRHGRDALEVAVGVLRAIKERAGRAGR